MSVLDGEPSRPRLRVQWVMPTGVVAMMAAVVVGVIAAADATMAKLTVMPSDNPILNPWRGLGQTVAVNVVVVRMAQDVVACSSLRTPRRKAQKFSLSPLRVRNHSRVKAKSDKQRGHVATHRAVARRVTALRMKPSFKENNDENNIDGRVVGHDLLVARCTRCCECRRPRNRTDFGNGQ